MGAQGSTFQKGWAYRKILEVPLSPTRTTGDVCKNPGTKLDLSLGPGSLEIHRPPLDRPSPPRPGRELSPGPAGKALDLSLNTFLLGLAKDFAARLGPENAGRDLPTSKYLGARLRPSELWAFFEDQTKPWPRTT